jgi:WD40 repeat protein
MVSDPKFSPDGRTLAVETAGYRTLPGDADERRYDELSLYDVSDRTHLSKLAGLGEGKATFGVVGFDFSPDGRTLTTAFGLDRDVYLWDITNPSTPAILTKLPANLDVFQPVFSPDGRFLIARARGSIILWEVTDRTHPRRLAALVGESATFGMNGILAVDDGGTWILWDIVLPARPMRLFTIRQPLLDLTFSPDGRVVAGSSWLGDSDRQISMLDLTSVFSMRADPSRIACAAVGHGLMAEEWARYVPELPYQATCGGR